MKNLITRLAATAASLLFLTTAANAEPTKKVAVGKIALKPQLITGASYQIEQLVLTKMGKGDQEHRATQNHTLTVTAADRKLGDKLVSSKVDRVRIETSATGDGKKISYDTADRKKQHPALADIAKGMMSVTSAAVFTKDDKFKKFSGAVEDESAKEMMQKLTDLGFPEKKVGPGDQWKHKFEADMGQMGTVRYDLDYRFTRMISFAGSPCAQLAIKGSMSTLPGAAANEGFDLKSRSLQGVMYFDPKFGVVRKFEINSKLELTAYGKKMPGAMVIRRVLERMQLPTKTGH